MAFTLATARCLCYGYLSLECLLIFNENVGRNCLRTVCFKFSISMKTALQSRNSLKWLLLTIISILVTYTVPAQSVQEEWARQYGSANQTLESDAIVTSDAEGNTYLVGGSSVVSILTQNPVIAIIVVKYNPAGEEVWRNIYRNDLGVTARSIALDETGLYVVGGSIASSLRSFTILLKFDLTNGEILWSASQQPGRFSLGINVLTDNKGGVILTGNANFLFSGNVSFIAKYNASDGQLIWERNLSEPANPANYQDLAGIALDGNGDIYVASTQGREGLPDRAVTTKFRNEDGAIIWQQFYETGQFDRALRIAVDATGGIYTLVSTSTGMSTEPVENTLLKYSALDGAQIWIQEVIGTGIPGNLIADSAGGLYLTSTVPGITQQVRYSAENGQIAWIKPIEGDFVAMDVDAAGNLYVASRPTGADYLVRRYNANSGGIDWEQLSAGVQAFDEWLADLDVSEAGFVHLVGTREDSPVNFSKIIVATHQAASGDMVFKTTFPGTIPGADFPAAVTTDGEGNIYIAGTGGGNVLGNSINDIIILKYSPAGDILWESKYADRFRDEAHRIAVDGAGHVYVLGTTVGSDGRPDAILLKYNGDTGDLIWNVIHGPGQANFGTDMKLDNQGDIYVTGLANSMFDVRSMEFISKIDAETGDFIWGKRYSREIDNSELHDMIDFALDEVGDLYVTGIVGNGITTGDIVTVKYKGMVGNQEWIMTYDSGHRDGVTGLETDNSGGVYLTGFSDIGQEERISYLIKYNASNGEQLWLQPSPDQGTTPGIIDMLTLDNAGGAYVGGFINGLRHIIKFKTTEPGVAWSAPYQGLLSEIETDKVGSVYATGINNNNILTTKYNAADGSRVWEVEKKANTSIALLTLDPDNNVIVAGTVFAEDTNFDILTAKYSQEIDPCNIPVQVRLYLPPMAKRVGWQVRTTADFRPYILGADHGVRWTWGDGTASSIAYTALGTSRITGEHTYTNAGIYPIGLDFSQSCLRPTNGGYEQWMPIFDPEAGFVTGAGQATANGERLGFNFSVRYSGKYAAAPTGQTHLQIAGLGMFRSRSLDWVVVTGDKAAWKGEGVIDGKGRYGFIASVSDAGGPVQDDPGDRMRVVVWDIDRHNRVVYDSFGQGGEILNLSNQGSAIDKGNIVIHRPNNGSISAKGSNNVRAGDQAHLLAYPNTFSESTTISFSVEQGQTYTLELYDTKGRLVRQLADEKAKAGGTLQHELSGSGLNEGLYIVRLVTDDTSQSIKLLMKR